MATLLTGQPSQAAMDLVNLGTRRTRQGVAGLLGRNPNQFLTNQERAQDQLQGLLRSNQDFESLGSLRNLYNLAVQAAPEGKRSALALELIPRIRAAQTKETEKRAQEAKLTSRISNLASDPNINQNQAEAIVAGDLNYSDVVQDEGDRYINVGGGLVFDKTDGTFLSNNVSGLNPKNIETKEIIGPTGNKVAIGLVKTNKGIQYIGEDGELTTDESKARKLPLGTTVPLAVDVQERIETQQSIPSLNKEIGQLDSLITQFQDRNAEISGGLVGSGKEFIKEIVGAQDEVSELRIKLKGVITRASVGNLPPGPATDKDIQLVLSGEIPANANAATVISYLNGLKKLANVDRDYAKKKVEYMSNPTLGNGRSIGFEQFYTLDNYNEFINTGGTFQSALDYLKAAKNAAETERTNEAIATYQETLKIFIEGDVEDETIGNYGFDPFEYEKTAKRSYNSLKDLGVSVDEFEALGFE